MTNITLYTSTRQCIADNYFLGYEGENKINKLIFKFDDGFRDGLGILNIQRGEEKGYLDLEKVGNTYELEVKSALLTKKGEITFQLSINEPDGTVIKYDAFQMTVKDSIDTDTEMPEDYPNWVDMANAKLAEVDEAIRNVETVIDNANNVANELLQAKENGEFDGKDGFSPLAKVIQTEEGAEIEITDENGTTKAVVRHGQGGSEGSGEAGADGFSPIANVTQTDDGAIINITDKTGTSTAVIKNGKDGEKGDPGEPGKSGTDGLTPYIGANGNWWIGDTDTGVNPGGSGGGSKYNEINLINAPLEYSMGTSSTKIDQDLVLLDAVTNYDEVIFVYDVYKTNGSTYTVHTNSSLLVSEIVYNDSETAIAEGDTTPLNAFLRTSSATAHFACMIHFRNETTIRLRSTVSSDSAYSKFRIKAIKGIKY